MKVYVELRDVSEKLADIDEFSYSEHDHFMFDIGYYQALVEKDIQSEERDKKLLEEKLELLNSYRQEINVVFEDSIREWLDKDAKGVERITMTNNNTEIEFIDSISCIAFYNQLINNYDMT